ncbi:MAG TPA: YbaB/EbfC family nucleoid-associated protein [Pseudonocardiaceae bacterium]|jgi:DNA-binding protein YbaB|nr:YbaB/EbfC family nucleoid-associated protein [Pseudonocardiaceae bacterium]
MDTADIDGGRTEAMLDNWLADAEASAARYQQLGKDMAAVSVAESSPDGLITVTVDAGGLVIGLRISERATESAPGPALAATVLATMRRAQARIAGQVAELMRTTIGSDPAMEETVLGELSAKFPEPPPSAWSRSAQQPPAAAQPSAQQRPVAAQPYAQQQPASPQPLAPQPQSFAAQPVPHRARPPQRRPEPVWSDDDNASSVMEGVDER